MKRLSSPGFPCLLQRKQIRRALGPSLRTKAAYTAPSRRAISTRKSFGDAHPYLMATVRPLCLLVLCFGVQIITEFLVDIRDEASRKAGIAEGDVGRRENKNVVENVVDARPTHVESSRSVESRLDALETKMENNTANFETINTKLDKLLNESSSTARHAGAKSS